MGEVPDSLPVTDETRDRLRSQANQLGEAEVLRLVDLLAVAVDDVRQGGDPRLPLELAFVKVTRPGADLSRQSLAYRLDQLESRARDGHHAAPPAAAPATEPDKTSAALATDEAAPPEAPVVDLEQLQHLWKQAVLPAVSERSIPTASVLGEARPVELAGERLVIEFPPAASFHRNLAEEPKNATLLADVLHEITGHRLQLAFAVGEEAHHDDEEPAPTEPQTEEEFVSLFKNTFDAREVEEPQ
jgi:DNA polymerase-3 subunit gamma/tau